MKYLVFSLFLSLSACNMFASPKFHIGQYVTNGYCSGYISSIYSYSEGYEYKILSANCGPVQFNYVNLKENDLKAND